MQIAIYGLGYVGLTAAGCLTKQGHQVIGVDISADKVAKINRGEAPIAEPGLDALIENAILERKLRALTSLGTELNDCQIALVCVGTPSGPDGAHNMGHVAEVSRQIASAIFPERKEPLTVIYRSTMKPGTVEELIYPIFLDILGDAIALVDLVYNPEFLRESVAITDFFSPPKIVVGTKDGKPSSAVEKMNVGIEAPVFYTSYREAELTKFVDNTFHALKVSFANEIGRICMGLDISAEVVHRIFVSDTKLNISPYYLRPGGAFGGSCLPKDVRALQYLSATLGADTAVIDALMKTNEAHKRFLYDYCIKGLPEKASILMIGLAFKPDSDDLRESPNLDIARSLVQAGYNLEIYDESLRPSALLGQNLGHGYVTLPNFGKLLVSKERVMAMQYDRVIDTTGRPLPFDASKHEIIHINALP